MDRHSVAAGVKPEQAGGASGGADLVEKNADCCGFSRAVGAEETEDLPGVNLKVNSLECFKGAVLFAQSLNLNGLNSSHSSFPSS